MQAFENQRFWRKYRHLPILHGLFVFHIGFSDLPIFGKCEPGVRNWSVSMSWREIKVFNPQT